MTSCKEAGLVRPVIDRNRCEGKADCVRVCPYHVFELGTLDAEARASLSGLGRVRAFFHGYRQALVIHGEACQSCGLCVTECPEKAIKLAPVGS
jgi:NAD-dependent dihydropyrimidine dehydrogenase PreA subunit